MSRARLAALLAVAAFHATALAQVELSFGDDSPISVRAETATYLGGLTVLETDVIVSQNATTVWADRMDIYREESGDAPAAPGSIAIGALKRIEAEGSFRFENPENTITGARGIYYADRELFIVTGDVVLTRASGASVRGDRLVYNTATGSARFGTPCETGTAPEGEACETGRVTIRIE